MSTTRCDGYVGSRIASRYDEDEEDDYDGGVGEEVDPDGTIPEEDEELEEQASNTVNYQQSAWHHWTRSPTVIVPRVEVRGSISQNRTRTNRYRRAFGSRW